MAANNTPLQPPALDDSLKARIIKYLARIIQNLFESLTNQIIFFVSLPERIIQYLFDTLIFEILKNPGVLVAIISVGGGVWGADRVVTQISNSDVKKNIIDMIAQTDFNSTYETYRLAVALEIIKDARLACNSASDEEGCFITDKTIMSICESTVTDSSGGTSQKCLVPLQEILKSKKAVEDDGLKEILEGYKGTIEENNNEPTRLNNLILELQNELEKPEAVEDDGLKKNS